MKNHFKIDRLLIFLLVLIGASCTDNQLTPRKKRIDFIETIKIDNDIELQGLLKDLNTSKTVSGGRSLTTDFGEVGLDNALKLNDTIFNRTRYSLGIKRKKDSLIFENLVIVKRKEGVFQYIVQYKPDPYWYLLNYKKTSWATFTGTIRQLTLQRELAIEIRMKNGRNNGVPNKGGRTQECCNFRIGVSSATGNDFLDIDCPSGYRTILFTRTSDCGGGGGDPIGNGGGSGNSGGGGSSGGSTNPGDGGGGGSGSGNSGPQEYTNPIGIYKPGGTGIADMTEEEIQSAIEAINDPEEKRKAQLEYLRTHGASEFFEMVTDLVNTQGITVGEVWDINNMVNKVYLSQKAQFFIAIFNPETVGTILSLGFYSPTLSTPVRSNYFRLVARYASTNVGKGFSSFDAFKNEYGAAGEGKAWHHLVQQTETNVQRFGAESIHNTNNLIRIEHGAATWHQRITNYYNSIQEFTDGQRFYQWVGQKSFQEQYEWALKIMELTKTP
jgi:hypothetical protein